MKKRYLLWMLMGCLSINHVVEACSTCDCGHGRFLPNHCCKTNGDCQSYRCVLGVCQQDATTLSHLKTCNMVYCGCLPGVGKNLAGVGSCKMGWSKMTCDEYCVAAEQVVMVPGTTLINRGIVAEKKSHHKK